MSATALWFTFYIFLNREVGGGCRILDYYEGQSNENLKKCDKNSKHRSIVL